MTQTHKRWTLALVLAGFFIAAPVGAGVVVLYDGGDTTRPLPSDQGWSYGADAEFSPGYDNGATVLDTSANMGGSAGYFSRIPIIGQHPGVPVLDRETGFSLMFTAKVLQENHVSPNRAGFSVIVITHDPAYDIEIGFWENEVWAQDNGFVHGESATFDTKDRSVRYVLYVRDDRYLLMADGATMLQGPLRNYTEPRFPYGYPNIIFFGDDTGSASAVIRLEAVSIAVHVKGDLDGDDAVTLKDAVLGLMTLSGATPLDIFLSAGPTWDVNGDLRLGTEEVLFALHHVAGLR